jgi:restriction system protein
MELSPIDFEKWVKSEVFESTGWKVEETKVTGDGGIDLVITKGDERSVAQCKRFRGTVGEPMIRDFYGAMMHEGVSRGFFITTGMYSLSALKFAEDKPIEMIDRRVLASKYL